MGGEEECLVLRGGLQLERPVLVLGGLLSVLRHALIDDGLCLEGSDGTWLWGSGHSSDEGGEERVAGEGRDLGHIVSDCDCGDDDGADRQDEGGDGLASHAWSLGWRLLSGVRMESTKNMRGRQCPTP